MARFEVHKRDKGEYGFWLNIWDHAQKGYVLMPRIPWSEHSEWQMGLLAEFMDTLATSPTRSPDPEP